ncbi:MAG: Antitoxin (modular protein) [Nitrospira sp.]|nr:MAG: Antitoxin (modular protein) [Nitrospira sp.]
MRYSSHVKPISYLKANAAEVLAHIAEQREPLVITQNGEAQGCAAGCGIVRRNPGEPDLAQDSGPWQPGLGGRAGQACARCGGAATRQRTTA